MHRVLPTLRTSTGLASPKHVCRGSSRLSRQCPSLLTQSGRRIASVHSSARTSFHESGCTRIEIATAAKPSANAGHAEAASLSSPRVATDVQSKSVYVTWSSGITSKYHNVWLRDHCRCAHCYHPSTKQRLLNTFEIAPDTQPVSVESTTEGLLVHWPLLPSELAQTGDEPASTTTSTSDAAPKGSPADGVASATKSHPAMYPWRWLMDNSYSPLLAESSTATSETSGQKSIEKVLWGKGIGSAPPTVKYDEVMQSDEGVLKWLTKVAQYGFAFVTGVPPTPTDTEALIRRIAFIRETHYGGFWDFTSDLAHGDTAYTDLALQAHTDTTYFSDPAGLQMFHLLSHTASKSPTASSAAATAAGSAASPGKGKTASTAANARGPSGGESLLVDGFLAAAVLKDVDPEAYDTLSRVKIRTHSAGDESTMIRPLYDGGYPILQHDEATGQLVLVRYNNDDRSVLRIDADQVDPFYSALRKWNEILTNPEGEYWVQLKPGSAMIFDNHRVLHGRSAFVGNRRLCGAYINHDDYRSRLSVLSSQFSHHHSQRGVWDDGL